MESNLKIESEISNDEFDEKPVKTGNGLKLLVGFLGAALIGGGIYAANKV